MPGADDEKLLQNAASLRVDASRQGDRIAVDATIVNDRTGHHVPTDSPLRQMILLVQASDAHGQALPQLEGPTLPGWCGRGDPRRGYYAGLPGKAFAKILEERWTGISPTGAYWNPTRLLSDNRIAALDSDTSRYLFLAPREGQTTIEVRLLFRRAFKQLMDQKGWSDPDILMAREAIVVSGPNPRAFPLGSNSMKNNTNGR